MKGRLPVMRNKPWERVIRIVPSIKGRALLLASVMFIVVGISNIATAHELAENSTAAQAYKAQFFLFNNLQAWGSFFIASGVWALISVFRKKYYLGFFSLMLMSMWWSGLFVASLVMTGYNRVIPTIFTWALISVFLYIISSWPEEGEYEK